MTPNAWLVCHEAILRFGGKTGRYHLVHDREKLVQWSTSSSHSAVIERRHRIVLSCVRLDVQISLAEGSQVTDK